jgi:hypothetical protein
MLSAPMIGATNGSRAGARRVRDGAAHSTTMQAHATASGIAGDVILQPVSPVERPGSTNSRPYEALIGIVDKAGRTIAEVRSDANGRFDIVLEPGTYVVRPESPAIYPHAPAQTVTVAAGRFTPVHIVYDSGIR